VQIVNLFRNKVELTADAWNLNPRVAMIDDCSFMANERAIPPRQIYGLMTKV